MKTSEQQGGLDTARIAADVNYWFQHQKPERLTDAVVYSSGMARELNPTCSHYRLILGACQYPAGLLDGLPAYTSFERLADKLSAGEASCDAMVLTGDQIYIDITAGLFDPTQLDDNYRRSYERWLHQPAIRRVMSRVPVVCIPDDHEIRNNWEPVSPDADREEREKVDEALNTGKKNYFKYQRGSGPFPGAVIGDLANAPLWCSLQDHGLPVFIADTRTERENRHAGNIAGAKIMGEQQFAALTSWLAQEALAELPKIVVSPSILLPRHSRVAGQAFDAGQPALTSSLYSDSWDGYPASMQALLGFITEHQIRNVVFLSGDEHLGCIATAGLKRLSDNATAHIHSVHSSALYAPYPFANARPADLMAEDSFDFTAYGGGKVQCTVQSECISGEGFTLLDFARDATGEWQLTCVFERAEGNEVRSVPLRP